MFEKNTKQVNEIVAHIFAVSTIAIVFMVVCSWLGVFEFGKKYTEIVFIAGLVISISPSILIHVLSDNAMKYYMLIILSLFIGILGTSNHIGIYISYALVPIFSCLYFEPALILKSSLFSYIVMVLSVYVNSANKYEVLYQHRSRVQIFIAYVLGFTIEYVIVNIILYFLVKRARKMMEERYSAEEENQMKSQFLSNMSHEIRTPMNAILGMADVALRKEMSDDLRKNITIIKSSSMGLLEIINDILDLSKIEAGKLNMITEAYSVTSLVEDMTAIIDARNVDKKVPIYYHIQENMPETLEGDAVRIKQVMLNYASNAIKYTDTGRIDISLACEPAEEDYINLIYTVKDTGQGICQDDMNRLFTMYTQLNEKENHGKEGTGIGLAISKCFVDRMHGTVNVKSTYGSGSTFSFSIPQKVLNDKCKVDQKYTDKPDRICNFHAIDAKILLVDDNEINREVVKAMIEPLGLVIDEADNGLKAASMAKDTRYDLIFMDSHMPVMNGLDATKTIRSESGKSQHVPIIAITADAITGVKERLLQGGMDDYMVKPIDLETICQIIRKYLPEEKICDL